MFGAPFPVFPYIPTPFTVAPATPAPLVGKTPLIPLLAPIIAVPVAFAFLPQKAFATLSFAFPATASFVPAPTTVTWLKVAPGEFIPTVPPLNILTLSKLLVFNCKS